MDQRNQTIDVAKGIGILLVVFGHSWIVLHEKGELSKIIFSFHMPLFFFLSGVFLNTNKTLISFTKSKISSLLKPYFSAIIILLLINISFEYFTKSTIDLQALKAAILGIFYGTGTSIEWTPLWFLPVLCRFQWNLTRLNRSMSFRH
jgi:fucose 4-O-acetylase-like acetyltransferase